MLWNNAGTSRPPHHPRENWPSTAQPEMPGQGTGDESLLSADNNLEVITHGVNPSGECRVEPVLPGAPQKRCHGKQGLHRETVALESPVMGQSWAWKQQFPEKMDSFWFSVTASSLDSRFRAVRTGRRLQERQHGLCLLLSRAGWLTARVKYKGRGAVTGPRRTSQDHSQ